MSSATILHGAFGDPDVKLAVRVSQVDFCLERHNFCGDYNDRKISVRSTCFNV